MFGIFRPGYTKSYTRKWCLFVAYSSPVIHRLYEWKVIGDEHLQANYILVESGDVTGYNARVTLETDG